MSSDDAASAAILDTLIPGSRRWPCFSRAVETGPFVAGLSDDMRDRLKTVGERDGADLATALATWERAEPETFAVLLRAVHRAYYTAPRVLAVLRDLAEESPREPMDRFDPQLVAKVVATDAGKRRL